MADIANELNAISTSIYGREMRGAIHDALETVNNDNENIHDEIAQIENIFAIDEEQDADESLNTTKCIFINGIFTRDIDANYRCKIYHGLNIADNTWVFDTYCADVSVPVAILCVNATGELSRYCVPIYAERVGAVNKTIPITKEGTGYPSDTCTIVINSYQNIPTLYKHGLNVYTKSEIDALDENKASKTELEAEASARTSGDSSLNTAIAVERARIDQIKSATNNLDNRIFDIEGIKVNNIQGVTFKTGSSNIDISYITINSLATYDSYYKVVNEPTTIWFENTESAYVAICVGENYTRTTTPEEGKIRLYCSNLVRYRKSEGNLPTRNNPIVVPAGGVFAITVTAGGTDTVYGLTQTRTVNKEFALETTDKALGVTVEFGTDSVTLTGRNYSVRFDKITTTQGYQWNITSLSSPTGNNVLPLSTDIIGVLQYEGENNFIGGVHGNESNVEFSLWAEGKQITENGIYKNVRVWMNSHLYSVNNPTVNAVDRFVEMRFDEHGWISRNTFKILVGGTIKVSYASGLFGFNKSDVNMAVCNLGPIDLTATRRQYDNINFKQLIVNLIDNLTVTLKSDTGENGFVTYRSSTDSYKAYFADVNNQVVSAGDYITGECEYIF